MTRAHDHRGIRPIPATNRTAIRLNDTREIQACGTGPEIEALLIEERDKKGQGNG